MLVKISVVICEEIAYILVMIGVNQYVYWKCSCPCRASAVHTTNKIKKAIPGCIALIAQDATQKYPASQPIRGQVQILERSDLFITHDTLYAWMIKIGELLLPITKIMLDDLLGARPLQCDETPLTVQKSKGFATSKKSCIWSVARRGPEFKIIHFEFDKTRSGKVPCRLFSEFIGSAQVNGYEGYDRLFLNYPKISRIGLAAHVRRGLTDLMKTLKKKSRSSYPANKNAKAIGQLYDIEEKIRGQDPKLRRDVRLSDAAAIFQGLQQSITKESLALGLHSLYGETLANSVKELLNIRRYLDDEHAESDNNLIENIIRPFCLGLRNWLLAVIEFRAQASATISTVLQTVKANGQEPAKYLAAPTERLPYCNEIVDFEALLPYTRVN